MEEKVIQLDLKKIGWLSLLMTIVPLLLGFLFLGLTESGVSGSFSLWSITTFIVVYFLLIVLHEAVHLVAFRFIGKVPWSSLDYGINWKLGVAYATTSQSIANRPLQGVLIAPLIVTGLLPFVYGVFFASPFWLISGCFLIGGAAGDVAMIKALRGYPANALVRDDPNLPKLYVQLEKRPH
ncbi:DUF3267 domain-containing protein [Paenisporosarcina cavernae]|nr:DUF3267 domain-containing protein [Paenisporosarcina cavernae]